MSKSSPSTKYQRYEYQTVVLTEHARPTIEQHSREGWQLAHMIAGGFSETDRWLDCALTLIFERPVGFPSTE